MEVLHLLPGDKWPEHVKHEAAFRETSLGVQGVPGTGALEAAEFHKISRGECPPSPAVLLCSIKPSYKCHLVLSSSLAPRTASPLRIPRKKRAKDSERNR